LLNYAIHLHDRLFSSYMSGDADAVDDNKPNNTNATDKLTNNHVDIWNVDILNHWNNDSGDFRSNRRDNVG
jgi:hypothetical protein